MLLLNVSKSKYMIFQIKEHFLIHNFHLKLHLFGYNFNSRDNIDCKCKILGKVEEYKYH